MPRRARQSEVAEYLRGLPKDPSQRWEELPRLSLEVLTRKLPVSRTRAVLHELDKGSEHRPDTSDAFLFNDLCAAKVVRFRSGRWELTDHGRALLRHLRRL